MYPSDRPLYPVRSFSRHFTHSGWGGRSAIRKGGRGRGGGAHILSNPSVHQIKGVTLSLNSAIAEYGISRADLEHVPCTWRSCHGNSYPLYQRSDVLAAVANKRACDPTFASAEKVKQDAKELAAAQAAFAEATEKVNEIEASILNGGYLGLTGINLSIRERLPKTDAKSLYCLDDSDLRGLSVTYGRGMMGNASENYLPEELLRAAEAKHGGPAGFLERRRKQQQRTRKKDLDEWKGKRASAQAAVARLAPLSSRNAGGAAAAASSSSSAVTSVPSSSGGGGKAKAPATSTPTTVGEAATKKSAFAVLMETSE